MDEVMKSVEAPKWMLDLFKAVDALGMSATSGFDIFADDIEMVFGDHVVRGHRGGKTILPHVRHPVQDRTQRDRRLAGRQYLCDARQRRYAEEGVRAGDDVSHVAPVQCHLARRAWQNCSLRCDLPA